MVMSKPSVREDLYDFGLNDFPEEWSDWLTAAEREVADADIAWEKTSMVFV